MTGPTGAYLTADEATQMLDALRSWCDQPKVCICGFSFDGSRMLEVLITAQARSAWVRSDGPWFRDKDGTLVVKLSDVALTVPGETP